MSPRTLITGGKFDFGTMPKVLFGAYVKASTDANITNDMKSRTHPCIGLGPAGNMQGSLKCFDIKTGKVVTRRTIKVITMPDDNIKTVNRWGQGQRAVTYGNKLEFLIRVKYLFDWENKELDLVNLVD